MDLESGRFSPRDRLSGDLDCRFTFTSVARRQVFMNVVKLFSIREDLLYYLQWTCSFTRESFPLSFFSFFPFFSLFTPVTPITPATLVTLVTLLTPVNQVTPVTTGNFWSLLGTSGNYRYFMTIPGTFLLFLVISGTFWQFLVQFSNSWYFQHQIMHYKDQIPGMIYPMHLV